MSPTYVQSRLPSARITVVVGDFGGTPHLLDHDEQMSIRLFHHFWHRRVRRRNGHADEIGPDHRQVLDQPIASLSGTQLVRAPPIPDIQQDTYYSDGGQCAKRQGVGMVRSRVDTEQFTDQELDV